MVGCVGYQGNEGLAKLLGLFYEMAVVRVGCMHAESEWMLAKSESFVCGVGVAACWLARVSQKRW